MIDVLATLIAYQHVNCLEYNANSLSKIPLTGDYLVGYKTIIPQNTCTIS